MRKLPFWFPLAFLVLFSCSSDLEDDLLDSLSITDTNTTYTYSYSSDIAPIITNNCQPCHGSGIGASAVSFDSYDAMSGYTTPSLMIDYLESGYMPAGGGSLHDSLITKIEIWYDEGVPNN